MSESLIPAAIRPQLKGLRLMARRAASDGIGQHVSRNRGDGLEFAQYRAYEPGDEPRRIDWKLFARSDRYFVRESERDSALTVWLMIDASASMNQADEAKPEFSKLDASKILAASIIEIALRQSDRFGLITIANSRVDLVPAAAGTRQRDRCEIALRQLKAGGGWPDETALRPVWDRIHADHMAVLLSDDFDDAAVQLVERLASARREVLSVQLLSGDERDFRFRGNRRFVDPESGAELRSDGAAARENYLRDFAEARAALARRFAASGVRHVEAMIDKPLILPMQALFGRREELA
ncbi:MAG: DUF58 domain-containing protein [Dokdonella sp.]